MDLHRHKRKLAVLAIVAAIGAIFGAWLTYAPHLAKASRATGLPTVPVTTATVRKHDIPIFLSGLGTVQAVYTVSIHAQVDGKLQQVFFTEGQHVKKGDVLAKIDPALYQAAYDQAVAKKAQDDALLIAARKDLSRFQTLAAKDFATQQSLDQQQAKVDQLIATVAADTAAIESAQTQLSYTDITAPSDGRMGIRQIDPGNVLHASDQTSLATLTLTQPAAVIFTLPSRSLDEVRDAMAHGEVEVVAYDQDNKRLLSTGKLLLIDNLIDQATSTIRLKAMFENKDERLWPGEFVNARLLLKTEQGVAAVPPAAVQRGPNGTYAWVITPEKTAQMKPIAIGSTAEGLTIVTSGLAEGDTVVTDGQYKLQVNSPISVAPTTTAEATREHL